MVHCPFRLWLMPTMDANRSRFSASVQKNPHATNGTLSTCTKSRRPRSFQASSEQFPIAVARVVGEPLVAREGVVKLTTYQTAGQRNTSVQNGQHARGASISTGARITISANNLRREQNKTSEGIQGTMSRVLRRSMRHQAATATRKSASSREIATTIT